MSNCKRHGDFFYLKGALLIFLLSFYSLLPLTAEPAHALDQQADENIPMITLPNFTSLAKKLTPVAVHVSTTKIFKARKKAMPPMQAPFGEGDDQFRDFFGDEFMRRFFGDMPNRDFKQQGLGSGFIIDSEGYILTNNHVIEGADEIKVTLANKKEYAASVIGRDEKTDIALIKIKDLKGDLAVADFGDSDMLEVGEWVMAIGNPFGLQETVTQGIVSAKWRKIGAGPYDDFIQTDASINPGNSGGPLFNMHGKVVGINTAIFTPSGGNVGIGFAIPINSAKKVIAQLKNKGRVVRGWLGVVVQKVTPELAESFGIKEGKGALVADVDKEGPAHKAGIESGDIILDFNGKAINEMEDLPILVAETEIGKAADIEVMRNGKKKTFSVTIGELKEKNDSQASLQDEKKDLGITVKAITPEMAQRYGLSRKEGVIVSQIEPGSPGEEAGLRAGDIIQEINRAPIKTINDYTSAVKKNKAGENVLFLVKRGENSLWIVLKQEK